MNRITIIQNKRSLLLFYHNFHKFQHYLIEFYNFNLTVASLLFPLQTYQKSRSDDTPLLVITFVLFITQLIILYWNVMSTLRAREYLANILTKSNKSPSVGAESTKWAQVTYLCQLEFINSNWQVTIEPIYDRRYSVMSK